MKLKAINIRSMHTAFVSFYHLGTTLHNYTNNTKCGHSHFQFIFCTKKFARLLNNLLYDFCKLQKNKSNISLLGYRTNDLACQAINR